MYANSLFTPKELIQLRKSEAIIATAVNRMKDFRKENKISEAGINNPQEIKRMAIARLAHLAVEVMDVYFMDSQHRPIHIERVSIGTIDAASVYPRSIVKLALEHDAASVILTHNHPSGCPEPSQADLRITSRINDALALIDVRVLDHIIVGRNETISLAERGLL